jgi:hypothetical protein
MRLRCAAFAVARAARPFGPMVGRLAVLLALGLAAGAPVLLVPSGAPGLPSAHASGADAPTGAMTVARQDGADSGAPPAPPPDGAAPAAPPVDIPTPTPTATDITPAAPAASPALPAPASPAVASPSPIPYLGELCRGDEQIAYLPDVPRANNQLTVVVTSAYENRYPRLAGTEKTTFVGERPGQLGYVWEWTIQATWPGRHQYTYYVDSTIPCQKVEILVRNQLVTPTPKPTKTPKPGSSNNDNS